MQPVDQIHTAGGETMTRDQALSLLGAPECAMRLVEKLLDQQPRTGLTGISIIVRDDETERLRASLNKDQDGK